MKRSLASLAVVPLVAIGLVAGPAVAAPAAAPIPPIKSTTQYQALKSYVATLAAKRTTPATQAQKDAFTAALNTKKAAVDAKAEALFQKRMSQITKKLDAQVARKTGKIREQRFDAINMVKQARAAKLQSLAAWKNQQVNQINSQFNTKVKPLQKELAKLQAKLAKTTNPTKRQTLQNQITDVQGDISDLTTEKNSDLQAIGTKYASRVQNAKNRFADKIIKVKNQANREIAAIKRQVHRKFVDDEERAKDRRTSDLAQISALYQQGVAYIAEMPLNG